MLACPKGFIGGSSAAALILLLLLIASATADSPAEASSSTRQLSQHGAQPHQGLARSAWRRSQQNGGPAAESSGIQVFIHVYALGHWKAILEELMHALLWSGLLDHADAVRIFVSRPTDTVGVASAAEDVETLARAYGRKVTVASALNDSSSERVTLHRIRQFVTPSSRFLYLHSKGVTRGPDHRPVRLWRRYMVWFLVRHWRTCVCLLGAFDTVGAQLRLHELDPAPPFEYPPHYTGNYWWTTGAWWLGLDPVIPSGFNSPEYHLLTAMSNKAVRPRMAALVAHGAVQPDLYTIAVTPVMYNGIANWTDADQQQCGRA